MAPIIDGELTVVGTVDGWAWEFPRAKTNWQKRQKIIFFHAYVYARIRKAKNAPEGVKETNVALIYYILFANIHVDGWMGLTAWCWPSSLLHC